MIEIINRENDNLLLRCEGKGYKNDINCIKAIMNHAGFLSANPDITIEIGSFEEKFPIEHGIVILNNDLKVELVNIGEGLTGDYNEKDPNDINFLRFYMYQNDGMFWCENTSRCTCIGNSADFINEIIGGAILIFKVFKKAIEDGRDLDKVSDELSCIGYSASKISIL